MPHKAMRIQLAHVFDLEPTYFLDDGELPGSQIPKIQTDELAYLHSRLESVLVQADVSDETKERMTQALRETTQKLMRTN